MKKECSECGEPAEVKGEGTLDSDPLCFECWTKQVDNEEFKHSLGVYK